MNVLSKPAIAVLLVVGGGCNQHSKTVQAKEPQPDSPQRYIVNLTHVECTGCLDANVLNSNYLPDWLRGIVSDSTSPYIMIMGRNPFKRSFFQEYFSDYRFKYYQAEGYYLGVDSNNPVGKVPIFFIEKYMEIDSTKASK